MHRILDGKIPSDDLQGFIRQLSRRGIKLWADADSLRYRAPKGALTDQDRQTLNCANRAIASLLQETSASPASDGPSSGHSAARRAPLSFTQLGYWNDRLAYGSQPIRHIAAVIRLKGRLRVELLNESLEAIGRRHDALRTRVVLEGEYPVQEVADRYRPELETIDLSSIPESRKSAEIDHQIQRAILEARDYASSPLFKAVLLSIDESEHVLILALDHMISDLTSLNLLFGEIATAYEQLLRGDRIALSPIAIQFPGYAAEQNAHFAGLRGSPVARFDSVARTRFPNDPHIRSEGARTGWGIAKSVIGTELRDDLREWAQRQRTTMVIATLTAYAASVMRLCGVGETVIPFVIDGRLRAELESTIGFLAFPIYIRMSLSGQSTFNDLLKQVTEEYCRACDEADFGCALAMSPRPEFTNNPAFNWLPSGENKSSLSPECPLSLTWSQMDFVNPLTKSLDLDAEPSVSFKEHDRVIACQVHYPRSRFSDRSIELFTAKMMNFIGIMISAPNRYVTHVDLK